MPTYFFDVLVVDPVVPEHQSLQTPHVFDALDELSESSPVEIFAPEIG